jgi:ABC-type bacteriocin/lantibiotic exporter with double-glycine peptidase domain
VVAHRSTTVAGCDRVYRLAAGHIVQEGAPADVLARAASA